MRIITCFGDQTRTSTFFIIVLVSQTRIARSLGPITLRAFKSVFNSVTSIRVLSYRCVLHYFLAIPVGFNFN